MEMVDGRTLAAMTEALKGKDDGGMVDEFRTAMRKVAASVTLITTRDSDGTPYGMAATAVISASMDPPSMLVAVNHSASIAPVLERSQFFCINFLSSDQMPVVETFSKSSLRDQRFTGGKWTTGYENLPVYEDVLTAIFCRKELVFTYGTHDIYVGRVMSVANHAEGAPLVWHAGGQAKIDAAPKR